MTDERRAVNCLLADLELIEESGLPLDSLAEVVLTDLDAPERIPGIVEVLGSDLVARLDRVLRAQPTDLEAVAEARSRLERFIGADAELEEEREIRKLRMAEQLR
jgi:hypothetical protein